MFLLVLIGAPAGVNGENIEAKLPTIDGTSAFQVQDSGGTPLMHVQADGKMGIGTTIPNDRLHINGGLQISGPYAAMGAGLRIGYDGNVANIQVFDYDVFSPKDLAMSAKTIQLGTVIGGGGVTAIHINQPPSGGVPGNVGIGTTNPQGALDVNGAIYQRGSSLHADYVFQPSYKLETIEEHAEFMWREKHLTAVPKASVDEHGKEILEVGSHRKGMLEELEKAHIYVAQLNSIIKEQNKTITALKTLICQEHSNAEICR